MVTQTQGHQQGQTVRKKISDERGSGCCRIHQHSLCLRRPLHHCVSPLCTQLGLESAQHAWIARAQKIWTAVCYFCSLSMTIHCASFLPHARQMRTADYNEHKIRQASFRRQPASVTMSCWASAESLLHLQGDHACYVEAPQVWLDLWHCYPLCADSDSARFYFHVLGESAASTEPRLCSSVLRSTFLPHFCNASIRFPCLRRQSKPVRSFSASENRIMQSRMFGSVTTSGKR